MNSPVRRGGLLVPGVAVIAALAVLLALGTWQLQRKGWKEALIGTLDRRLNDAPIALPPPYEWGGMTPDNSEFTPVRLHVEFPQAGDALVYTSGSSIRSDVKGAGYFVFSVAKLPGGRRIVVNRGFAPDRTYPPAPGPQDIVGYVRWPEKPSWFVADHDAAGVVWTVRDPQAMARFKDWGEVAPFYIDQEAPEPPGGIPHPAKLEVHLRDDHLQYAITWYGLAAALVVMCAIGLARRRREAAG
jgi:cytochrome oxidase assembly protein ShyY1